MKRRANPYLPGEGNPYSVGEPRRDPSVQNPEDLQYGLPDDMGDGQVAQPSTKPRTQPNGAPAPGSSANQPYGTGSAVATRVDLVCMACGRRGPVRLSTLARVGEGGKVLTCKCGSTDLDVDEGQQVKQARRRVATDGPEGIPQERWDEMDRNGEALDAIVMRKRSGPTWERPPYSDEPRSGWRALLVASGNPAYCYIEPNLFGTFTIEVRNPDGYSTRESAEVEDVTKVLPTAERLIKKVVGYNPWTARHQASYGTKQCPSCGGNNHENAGTCAHCGFRFPEPAWTARRRTAVGMTEFTNWQTDFDKLADALEPWVIDFGDGTQGLDPSAPEDLVRPYQALMQMGYANGWLASKRQASDRSGHSVTCPQCGATDIRATVHPGGERLDAYCDNCGWRGTKTKKASRRRTAAPLSLGPFFDSVSKKWFQGPLQGWGRGPYAPATAQDGSEYGVINWETNEVVASGMRTLAEAESDAARWCAEPAKAPDSGGYNDWSGITGRRRTASDDGSYGRNDAADICAVCGERILPSESGGDWWEHATIGPRKDHEARPAGRRVSRKPSRTLIRVKAGIKRTNPGLPDAEVDRIARRTLAKVGAQGDPMTWTVEEARRAGAEDRKAGRPKRDGRVANPGNYNDGYDGWYGPDGTDEKQRSTPFTGRRQRTAGNRVAIQGQYEYDWRLGVEDGRAGRPMDPHAAKSDAYKRGYEHGSGDKQGSRHTAVTTFEKWKNDPYGGGNYSHVPTKDVEILPNQPGVPQCRFCGADASHLSYRQEAWYDATDCSRCGGVSGRALGD